LTKGNYEYIFIINNEGGEEKWIKIQRKKDVLVAKGSVSVVKTVNVVVGIAINRK
jgi:hypothetical protein